MPVKRPVAVQPDEWGFPFSAAVRWGDLLFLSGQTAIDTDSMQMVGEDIGSQTEATFKAMEKLLGEAGVGFETVLRLECFLASLDDFAGFNEVFIKYFPKSPPARTTVVTGFVVPAMLVEVQATCGLTEGA